MQKIEKQFKWSKLDKLNLPNAAPRNSKLAVDSFMAHLGSHVVSIAHKEYILNFRDYISKYLLNIKAITFFWIHKHNL